MASAHGTALWLCLALLPAAQSLPDSPPIGNLSESGAKLAELEPLPRADLQKALKEHDYAAAETLLVEQAGHRPKSQSLLLLLADVLFLDGKQLNTILALKKAELLGPLEERSRYLLALCYVSIGRRNLAIPEFEKLAPANPTEARYPYWLARLMYRKADMRLALSYARQAVQLDPSFARAQDQLGLCYAGVGDNDEAIQSYQTAIRLSERQSLHWPWPALNLGTLYLRLNRLDEAEDAFSQSLAAEPKFPPAYYRLGQVFERKKQLERAIHELRRSAELDPTYPQPHYALARIYKQQSDLEAAERELRLFTKLRAIDNQKGIVRPDR